MKTTNTFTQFFGTERPGIKVTAITNVRLNSPYLTFIPARDDLMLYTIPKDTQGTIEELLGTTYKLHFSFTVSEVSQMDGIQQAIFSIRLRDFEKFFKKV